MLQSDVAMLIDCFARRIGAGARPAIAAASLLLAVVGSPMSGAAALPAPTPTSPAPGTTLPQLTAVLYWQLPAGAAQYQLQVMPAMNDGPGINVIRSVEVFFTVPPPPAWYGLLPDMTYTWRLRATEKTDSQITENDTSWGSWSAAWTFRTPPAGSAGIQPLSPAVSAGVRAGPIALQWQPANPAIFYFEVQASPDPSFNLDPATAVAPVWWNLVHGGVTSPPNSWTTPPLAPGTTYYWRVRPRVQGDGTPVEWSQTWSFTTAATAP